MSLTGGASILMVGQISIKLITFTLNQLLIRNLPASLIGLNQSVEFLDNYFIFLSTEAVRLSINRIPNDLKNKKQQIVKFSMLPSLIYLVIVLPLNYYYYHTLSDHLSIFQLVLVNLSIFIQIINEPLYNINQFHDFNFSKRVKFESCALLLKSGLQYLLLTFTSLSFVDTLIYSRLAYSTCLLVLYLSSIGLPKFDSLKAIIDLSYFKSIYLQLIFKNFLTQGDQIIINSTLGLTSQGYYSIISNYGSLIVRLIFQPIEESTRISITQLFTSTSIAPQEKTQQLNESLLPLCKFYFYLITLFQLFSYLNIKFAMSLILPRLSNIPELIKGFKLYWAAYLPLMSINGLLEALFFSCFSDTQSYSKLMFGNSLLFYADSLILIKKFGILGLIMSNLVNFTVRIVYCLVRLKNQLQLKISDVVSWSYLSAYIVSLLFQYWFFQGEVDSLKQFVVSALNGVFLCLVVVFAERTTVRNFVQRRQKLKHS
ncbi:unnamed protein product [Ambrosiozyma monospora]|uniref:Man(5)GlcNAc(2)-PP-dolichol translocation protein RFT1 n=1 Tax=Ambrosiozyma monospora TaxID=43982 RepID=A0A9W7DDC3_AMBMO|nr:unnamed protein product [Ambrosiozyma monospora]